MHDKSMLLKIAVDREAPVTRSWGADRTARRAMISDLRRRSAAVGARVVFAYEACGFGFLLRDELVAAGMECHVLAPSKMKRSVKARKRKTDERDAEAILDQLRAYLLAGVALPSVWIPDVQTRDDREVVRQRLTTAEDGSRAKSRIRWLLKRNGIDPPAEKAWTRAYWSWLRVLVDKTLPSGAAGALGSLVRHWEWVEEEKAKLDAQVQALSRTDRHAGPVAALMGQKGVGPVTAMVYLTEMGDLSRFRNRREVGSFLGLVPSSHESGEQADRKGHITHQGPARVRKVLCQAVWARIRTVASERASYDRLVARNPKQKKVAVVARMRRLAVVLWHVGLPAQQAAKRKVKEAQKAKEAKPSKEVVR